MKIIRYFDTCHTNDAGYNIKEDFSGVMEEFDKIIGLDRLKVLHINDSKIRKVRIKTGTPILVWNNRIRHAE